MAIVAGKITEYSGIIKDFIEKYNIDITEVKIVVDASLEEIPVTVDNLELPFHEYLVDGDGATFYV